MVRVNVNVDSDLSGHQDSKANVQIAAESSPDRIGLVSSVPLDPDMVKAFQDGADLNDGDYEVGEANQKDYNKNSMISKKNDHKGAGCKVIATVGGLVTFDAINTDNDRNIRFVSLVGNIPEKISRQFRGGVTLESLKSNTLRRLYLLGLAGGNRYTADNIFLYTNKNSQMHVPEKQIWGKDATFIESSAGDGAGTNTKANFAADFTQGGVQVAPNPAAPKAIIISDDPFFRAYRDDLITAVYTWLQGSNERFVIYPSQSYCDTIAPLPASQTSVVGPDLKSAMFLLGMLARYHADHKNAPSSGFLSVPNLTKEYK